ncbi:MAG: hypothetical protein V1661_02695 [bacterium]
MAFEKPPQEEQTLEETASEMAVEEEMSPEQEMALMINENFDQLRADLMELEMRVGPPTPEDLETIEFLKQSIVELDDENF